MLKPRHATAFMRGRELSDGHRPDTRNAAAWRPPFKPVAGFLPMREIRPKRPHISAA